MIIVTGSAVIEPSRWAEAVELSLRHVRRSRGEPGCVSHAVHQDVEQPNRLVFVEEWEGLDALRAHFAVPESIAFVDELAAMSKDVSMAVYDAQRVRA